MSWDIKIYEKKDKKRSGLYNMQEMETIRGLTESQKITLEAVLKRYKIVYFAFKVEEI